MQRSQLLLCPCLPKKVGRASKAVDAKIITDSALLGIYSPPGEFRSLLKFYSKLCHDALVKDDVVALEAVSRASVFRLIFANLVLGYECTSEYIKRNSCG